MKMTEKMKQSLVEGLKEKGVELSDEELNEVAGGRAMTSDERRVLNGTFLRAEYCHMALGYCQYIASLPEGSPEVGLPEFVCQAGPNFTVTYTCRHCGATVTGPVGGDYPICSGCGKTVSRGDALKNMQNYLH